MQNQELIISENEYKRLLLKFLDGATMTTDELYKLTSYEESLQQQSEKNQGRGTARSLSTPAGKAWVDENERQSGIASAILIVIGVIVFGIIAATLLIKL